ncbi:hypothetical protein [Bacteroides sp.]
MEDIDYREELENARAKASGILLRGYQNEIETYWEVVCGDVLVAEQNLREQDRTWEIASLVREFLHYARPLEEYDHVLNQLYEAVSRMSDVLFEHPRLKLELLEFEMLVVNRIECLNDHEMNASEVLLNDISTLKRNIRFADEERLEEIASDGHLKHDPVEWTARWEEIIDEADKKVYENLSNHSRGMGFCHAFWHERACVLKSYFGVNWCSPAVMNPGVLFD